MAETAKQLESTPDHTEEPPAYQLPSASWCGQSSTAKADSIRVAQSSPFRAAMGSSRLTELINAEQEARRNER